MQPYFFPYIGYFHLMHAVDVFVVYDNIQYTKKGWINRNRYLRDGKDSLFSIPLRKASDYCNVDQRELSEQFDRRKLLHQVQAAYRKAPFFGEAMELFHASIRYRETNLFRFIKHSLLRLRDHASIETEIVDSSNVRIDHSLRGQQKVLAICEALGATTYVNAIGGTDLYERHAFAARGMQLQFIKSSRQPYQQFDHEFVEWLSILDVLMFNSRETVRNFIQNGYHLITGEAAAA